ncbi:MAG: Omp28-related outer membrane protein [Cyclobacteriaceae bacterium]|nr:Omp28-related outer membrane protein [Cyclobacteriaceae bacterium]
MKKIVTYLLGLILLLQLQNCKETENSPTASSINLTATSLNAVTGETISFTVKTNLGTVVTSKSSFSIDNTPIVGTSYLATTPGGYTVKASYMGMTSNPITIIVSAPTSTVKFVKRVLLEDFTGTWCGWCPSIPFRLNELSKKTNLVVPVAIHVGGDPYRTETLAQPLITKHKINGEPTVILDRKIVEIGAYSKFDESALSLTSPKSDVGIAMSSTLSGTNVNLTVNAKFNSPYAGLSLVVLVLEDNLIYDQTNYTEYYGGTPIIKKFVNNDVLRGLLTKSIMGDPITEVIPNGFQLTKKFTYTIPSTYQKDKLHFVAFILNSAQEVINVRSAKLSETQSYEY